MGPLMITVLGPTASGKTRRAVELAKEFNGEIISGDSRQVYRGMDIGTGKDLDEYGSVPYHLIDVCDAGDKYDLHRFLNDFSDCFSAIKSRGLRPIFCGGSGMYVEAALNGLSLPEVPSNPVLRAFLEDKSLDELTSMLSSMKKLHNITDVDTHKRAVRAIEICEYYREHPDKAALADKNMSEKRDSLIIGIDIDRDSRRRRITERLKARLEDGMLGEVQSLLDKGIEPETLIYYGLEYKYLTLHLIGRISYDEMFSQLETSIHQFAKRQMTWFRGMERRGFRINWLPYDLPTSEFISCARHLLNL